MSLKFLERLSSHRDQSYRSNRRRAHWIIAIFNFFKDPSQPEPTPFKAPDLEVSASTRTKSSPGLSRLSLRNRQLKNSENHRGIPLSRNPGKTCLKCLDPTSRRIDRAYRSLPITADRYFLSLFFSRDPSQIKPT